MVTAQTQYRLAQAQSYFREHLAIGDYHQTECRTHGTTVEGVGRDRLLGLQGTKNARDPPKPAAEFEFQMNI